MDTVENGRYMTFACMMTFCLLLGARGQTLMGAQVGENVTLPCSYDFSYYGALGACWGRGPIPNRGCNGEVLRTDGSAVVSRLSERYRLSGTPGQGDVSLTIVHVGYEDSGIYGCRVDIPGWFNDHTHETILGVVAARPHPVQLELREVKEKSMTVRWSPGQDGGSPITGYRIDFKERAASWDAALTTEGISASLTQITLIDMRPNKAYHIRMFAENAVGQGEASNVVAVTTREAAPEGPPLDVRLEALTAHTIRVTWKPPRVELRHGVLRGYSVSYREYDPASRQLGNWRHQSVPANGEHEGVVVLRGLRPATQYGVVIQAKTAAGAGPAFSAPPCSTLAEDLSTSTQEPTTAATTFQPITTTLEQITTPLDQKVTHESAVPPDPPLLELLEVNGKQMSFRWTAGFDGGLPISSYDLEYKEMNASWVATQIFGGYAADQTETTVIEMHPSTYNIRMFAKNHAGSSQASNVLTVVIAEKGQRIDPYSTLGPIATQAAVRDEGVPESHPSLAAVPVLLILAVVVALAVTWQMWRKKGMKRGLNIIGFNRSISRFQNSEPLTEL